MLTFLKESNMGYTLIALIAFIAIDILTGLYLAYKSKTLSSTKCREGMYNKSLILAAVATGALFDPILRSTGAIGDGIPNLGLCLCIAFSISEVLSIFENLQAAGVKIPVLALALVRAAEKRQDAQSGSIISGLEGIVAPLTDLGVTPVVDVSKLSNTGTPKPTIPGPEPTIHKTETLPGETPRGTEKGDDIAPEPLANIQITYPL